MSGEAVVMLLVAGVVLMLCWAPTRVLLVWGAGMSAAVGLAMALGPMWFMALLLFLLLLK